ncbi:hypothetical protein LCGC14_0320650 [marine sediment metagenome]|uniref:Uncharacterized protein n=1 Tax=marine sediment metagenome TaxID=412755 RepID=A0A0F9WRE9_9ZZZZ|nr:hypothetical protein [bacterium]
MDIDKYIVDDQAKNVQSARFSEDFQYIIDSDGQKVELDDPRIAYVSPAANNSYGRLIIQNLYHFNGQNVRLSRETEADILQYSKRICSGRECLPGMAIAGAVLKDIAEYREEDEITIYQIPTDMDSACQNGSWGILWETFSNRLNVKNIILSGDSSYRNNYLGLNPNVTALETIGSMIGHYLTEARNALFCVAENRHLALTIFEKASSEYIESLKNKGERMLTSGLKEWVQQIKKIPIKAKVDETPKVLIFGGINLANDHYPVEKYFLEMGIIPKVVEYAGELTELLFSYYIVSFGFKRGYTTPKEQFDESLIDYSNLTEKELREAKRAKMYKNASKVFNSQCQLYRKIIEETGLLFDPQISFEDLLEKGNEFATVIGSTETPMITGKFITSLQSGVYDGLINLSTFNCQPAMNSQPIIRPLANKSDIPYAALDCEGPWLSTNQLRLLETIAVQAKRERRRKNELILNS